MDFVHRFFGAGAHTAPHEQGFLSALKRKYRPALRFAEAMGMRFEALRVEGEKLVIEAIAPSAEVRDTVLKEIELLDLNHSDLAIEIRVAA
jgi:hypothetical protein